jgi:hypothetical protein
MNVPQMKPKKRYLDGLLGACPRILYPTRGLRRPYQRQGRVGNDPHCPQSPEARNSVAVRVPKHIANRVTPCKAGSEILTGHVRLIDALGRRFAQTAFISTTNRYFTSPFTTRSNASLI